MIEAEYASFTEESNALDYLEKTVEFIHRTGTNSVDWKWVILSLHGALYGFMICALKGTDLDGVAPYNDKHERRLISFTKALEWCQDPRYEHNNRKPGAALVSGSKTFAQCRSESHP